MSTSYASQEQMNMPFDGAKLALFLGKRIAVIMRDDVPDIPFPGMWDLPGGGRDGGETPLGCALRETQEELGLVVPERAVSWGRVFTHKDQRKWFFVARMPSGTARHVAFGDEGQHWALMEPTAFVGHDNAIPQLQDRLKIFLEEQSYSEKPPAALSGGR